MGNAKQIISSKLPWNTTLLCIGLSIMGCSIKWIDLDKLYGLDENVRRVVATPSRVPVLLIPGETITRRVAAGYKFEMLQGGLKQGCWHDDKQIKFTIQHKQFHATRNVIGSHTLLVRSHQIENINSALKISVNGNPSWVRTYGEGWYGIEPFICAVNNALDAYFPVKTEVSIQSEGNVSLTAILLVKLSITEGRPVDAAFR